MLRNEKTKDLLLIVLHPLQLLSQKNERWPKKLHPKCQWPKTSLACQTISMSDQTN